MEPGMYDIMVVHWANGCVSYPDDQTITVEECPQTLIYIPNSFTPNGDEWNNTWQPVFTSGFDPFDFNLFVFNRWGEIIFESNNSTMGWDGTYKNQIVPEGIYIYRIQYGDPENGSSYILQGHVNMIN